MKQWSLKSVFKEHGYEFENKNNKIESNHSFFSNWVRKKYDKKIKIIDIGGCNGRVCTHLEDSFYEYWSFDISNDAIESGRNFFKDDPRVKFRLFDIDEEKIDEKCDVFYIDSVLTMIEKPFEALLKLKENSEYIFINRTFFNEETLKKQYRWGGMTETSTLWEFDYKTFNNFCEENDMELFFIKDNMDFIKSSDALDSFSNSMVKISNIQQNQNQNFENKSFDSDQFETILKTLRFSTKIYGLNSGMIISEDGFILTNRIDNGLSAEVTLDDDTKYKAQIIGTDYFNEISLLKIEKNNLNPIKVENWSSDSFFVKN